MARACAPGPAATANSPQLVLEEFMVPAVDPGISLYVRNKHRQAQFAGMTSRNESLPRDVLQRDAEALVRSLANDPTVNGIIVQQPVPACPYVGLRQPE